MFLVNITLALTPQQRTDARAALAILAPFGLSLEQAARLAVGRKAAVRSVTLAEAATAFLRDRLAGGVSRSTFDFYEERINRIADAFGARQMEQIGRSEFAAWVAGSSEGRASRAATARAARALWHWALRQDPPMVSAIVTDGLEFTATPNGADGSRKVLPVERVRVLMAKIPQQYRSAVALALFAGVRPEEIAGEGKERLTWACVNCAERIIRIPGELAKTKRTRIIEGLPDAIWRFMTPTGDRTPVCPATWRSLLYAAREATGLAVWPQDCLRHTFATYALALTQDSARVAHWLGHEGNPTMLHRHYRGLATKAQATAFFGSF